MRHYSKKSIIINFLKGIGVILCFGASIILSSIEEFDLGVLLFSAIAIIFMAIIYLIYCFIYYKNTGYIIDSEGINLKKGVFFRKNINISYDKINAIDYSQSLLERIIGIKTLKIDTGSTIQAENPEIVIIEDDDKIIEIENEIKSYMNKDKKEVIEEEKTSNIDIEYKFDLGKMILYSILSVMPLCLLAFAFVFTLSISLLVIKEFLYLGILLVCLVILIFISIFGSIIHQFLYNYNYEIEKNEDYIFINHGLFTRYHNTLPIKKVKAIIIEQNIVKRMFGFASVKIEVVGFGRTEEQATNLLFPLIKLNEINNYLSNMLPNFTYVEPNIKSKYFRFYLFIPSIFIIGLISVLLAFYPLINNQIYLLGVFLIGTFMYLLMLLNQMLSYSNSGLSVLDDRIIISNGSFTKRMIILSIKSMIGLEKKDTYCRRKKNTTSIIVHYFNHALKNTEKIKIIDDKCFDELNKVLIK